MGSTWGSVLRLVVLGRQPVSRMNRLILLLCLVHPSFQGQLFHLKPDVDTRDIKPCNDADAISCIVAEVDVSSLQDGSLDLPQDLYNCSMDFKNGIPAPMRRSGRANQTKSAAYEAEFGDAVVSIRDGQVRADIYLEEAEDPLGITFWVDRVFVLEPCKAFPGCHVLKEKADLEDDEDDDTVLEVPAVRRSSSFFSNRNPEDLRQKGIDDDTTIVTFSVKYYYTLDFAETFDDNDGIDDFFEQLTKLTNQGYIDSKIPVRLISHCIEATNLRDVDDSSKMLETFTNMKGSPEKLRGSADAAALFVVSLDTCGRAYKDGWRQGWRSGWTISVQKKKRVDESNFTFGHELGHNFGCSHDRTTNWAPYNYAYGHFIGPTKWWRKGYRSSMAYPKAGHRHRINYFSNPDVMYKGYPTGTEKNNCARVIKENRFGMAALGDESKTCTRR